MSDLVKRLQRSHTQLIRDEEFVLILKTHVDDAAAAIERKDAALLKERDRWTELLDYPDYVIRSRAATAIAAIDTALKD